MKIAIRNLQRKHRLSRERLIDVTHGFMRHVQHVQPDRDWRDFTLVLTDDSGIRQLNRSTLGHDEITDVISFCLPPVPGEPGDAFTAEIIVNVERAWNEGRRRCHWTPSMELALYIAHGCDHLTGWDDDTPESAARMRRREQRWIRAIQPKNLILS